MGIASERVSFQGSQGELAARLDRPEGEPRAVALFAHCFTCSKDIFAASRIARALADQGIAVLRFDFTGLGASEGEFASTNFSSNVEDLVLAATHLRETLQAPQLLVGHSLGGAAVLAARQHIPEARAVATIGAPADPSHLEHLLGDTKPDIEARGEAEVTISGRTFRIRKQFLDDIASQSLPAQIAKLDAALLVMHAPLDNIVGVDNATQIFVPAKHPKSFVSLDSADHLLTRHEDAVYAATVLAAWATRYIDPDALQPKHPKQSLPHHEVLVRETDEGKFTQEVIAGSHHLSADEPPTIAGGLDRGASPYEFLLTALGACTSMTLRMYADRKGIKLDRASVHLSHEKVHAKDCQDCETKSGKLDRIERVITLEGDLTAEQRARMLEIADMCPVHRTLHSEIIEVSRLDE